MNRIVSALMILTVALFFMITVFNNITDYDNTFLFVQHTLSMDTTKLNPNFMWRAIENPTVQHLGFVSIIGFQSAVAILCCWSLINIIVRPSMSLSAATQPAILGITLAFVLYALGFIIVAGQWFMMRESATWNVGPSVHIFITFIVSALIVIKLFEQK
jgi:predicted small integral membrane protein